ncbi:MAG: nucleotidyl transferase AbiEii/AbiGii toxin family protein [Pirellulales bacterium]
MLVGTGLTFREIVMSDPLPKGTIQQAVIHFLDGRDDAALFGAMAVNAYVDERRMTEDVGIVSSRAKELAEELKEHLSQRFRIAVRIRTVGDGVGYRLYQRAQPRNRHLVDLRSVEALPATQRIDGVLVLTPTNIIAGKVNAYYRRKGKPKAGTDWRDLAHLLLKFPELKTEEGPVKERLEAEGVGQEVLAIWRGLVAEEILPEEEDEEFL